MFDKATSTRPSADTSAFDNELAADSSLRTQIVHHIPIALLVLGLGVTLVATHVAAAGIAIAAIAHVVVGLVLAAIRHHRKQPATELNS